jgi:Flp pilus assembly protein TadD
MKRKFFAEVQTEDELVVKQNPSSEVMMPRAVPRHVQSQMIRMFRDPYVLEKAERTELVEQLESMVRAQPHLAELHVLLGMALCVNHDPQTALEELRLAVEIAPDNFLARLKFGELLMRLRICDQAAEQTRQAALNAVNPAQSELARRQAATIRTMQREGIERGGYKSIFSSFGRLARKMKSHGRRHEVTAMSHR